MTFRALPHQIPRFVLVISAALYVGCSPAGNDETGNGDGSTPAALTLPDGEAPEKFVLADPPATLPDTPFTDENGAEVRLQDFAGQVLVVNFWATWCPPCKAEMPSLDRLQEKLGSDTFRVLAISNDRGRANAVEPFFMEADIEHLTPYYDPMSELARALRVKGLPTTILVDAHGTEVGRIEGELEWDSKEALALIERIRAR